MKNFVTCHCHPSSLDSGSTPEDFAEREVELETGAITCTDHGSMAACRKIYDLAKEKKLTAVMGLEAYLRDDSCEILAAGGYQKNDRGAFKGAPKYMHVTLHYQDQRAYETGVKLLSAADARLEATLETLEPEDKKHGSERKPLFTWADLEELGGQNVTMTSSCFVPGTLVQTGRGLVPIEQCVEGDSVIDRDGVRRNVLTPTSRPWSGEVVSLKVCGAIRPIVCTPDHRFLYSDGPFATEWRSASELSKGDRVCLSVEQRPNLRTLPFSFDYVSAKSAYNESIVGDYADPDTLWAIGFFVAEGSFGSNAPSGVGPSTLVVSTHVHKDIEARKRFSSWALRMGATSVSEVLSKSPSRKKKGVEPKGLALQVFGRAISEWFLNLFGGRTSAKTKKIPEILKDLHPDLLRHLVKGYYDGDGHVSYKSYEHAHGGRQRSRRIVAATVSAQLADDLLAIFRRIDAKYNTHIKGAGIDKNGVSRQDAYYIIANGDNAEYLWKWMRGESSHLNCSGRYSSAITVVGTKLHSGSVHCLEIENEPSFSLSSGVTVHNCMIGAVQRHIFQNQDIETAQKYFEKLKRIVKPGNFYVEVFPHDTSKDWKEGVFIYLADGTELKLHDKKKLMTNVGEVVAKDLARLWGQSDHKVLKSIKDYSTWREMSEVEITRVVAMSEFVPNEPCFWAEDGDYQKGLNNIMLMWARKYQVPVLVGDDSHYAESSSKIVQDIRLAQNGPWRFYGHYHRQKSDEAFAHFQKTLGTTEKEFETWVENSHEWANRFKDFTFDNAPSLPTKFYEANYQQRPWYKEGDPDNSVRYAFDLINKHGRMDWKDPVRVDRLKQELTLLHDNGIIDLVPYFFIDEDVCSFYEEQGLLTGVGRGSAAGLLFSYLLGITHVDPIRYNLSLDRFITLDRIKSGKLPDIDQDLPRNKRDLLIDPDTGWLKRRFGDHYAQISVDTTMKLKLAVQDVARAMEFAAGRRKVVPQEIVNLTKRFILPPQGVKDYDFVMGHETDGDGWVEGSMEYDTSLKEYIRKFPHQWEIVQKVMGLARNRGRHPCGYIVANRPIQEFIPLTTVSGFRVTAYTAASVEAVGGVKMDFLGLSALDDIGDTIKLVQARSGMTFQNTTLGGVAVPAHRLVPKDGRAFDIWDLPPDQDVFADVACGRTETVFQFNTPGALRWLRHFAHKKENGNYAIDSIETMATFTALDRPGPLDMYVKDPDHPEKKHNMLVEYARRARGEQPSPDVLDVFNTYIPETLGVMCFQESLQRMYQRLTGCTNSEAEEFRGFAAKKKKAKLDKLYTPFVEKATLQIGEESAKKAWEFFITFAKYAFNLSHSVSYAVLAYASAYLKHHYPLEWWCSVLRNAAKNEINEKFWRHAGHLIDLPDVRLSGTGFEIQKERIRAPLDLLHGVGEACNVQIQKYAPYVDLDDFCSKIERHKVEAGTWSTKTKTVASKDPADKYRDPTTNRLVSKKIEVEVPVFKKGPSSLNRKVVTTLIVSGAMDSFFPPGTSIAAKLEAYEVATAKAMSASEVEIQAKIAPKKAPSVFKPEPVDPKVWDVGPLRLYQMKKAILPAYAEDLVPVVQSMTTLLGPEPTDPHTIWVSQWGRRVSQQKVSVVGVDDLEDFMTTEDSVGVWAAVAYVVDARRFEFEKEGQMQAACELHLDVEGGRYQFVKWGRNGSLGVEYQDTLKGSIVLVVLNRFAAGRSPAVEELTVIANPLNFDGYDEFGPDDEDDDDEENK